MIYQHNIARRLAAGLGANVFGQATVAFTQLIGVPIFLRCWGIELYGEWLLLFSIPSYLAVANLGFAQSAANDMVQSLSAGGRVKALGVFQSLFALTCVMAVAGLFLAVAIIAIVPDSFLDGAFRVMGSQRARAVLWILVAEMFVKFFDGVSHAGFRANGEYGLHTFVYYAVLLLQNILAWLAAVYGYGPIGTAAAYFSIRLLTIPAVAWWLVRRHNWLGFNFEAASVAELKRLLHPALANVCVPLAQALSVQGMILVVGATLGAVAVVTYSTLRTLTRLAFQLVVAVSQAAEPEIAAAYGRNDLGLLKTLYHGATRTGFWLAVPGAFMMRAAGPYLLSVWTRQKVEMDAGLFDFLLLSAVSSVVWFSSLTVLKAANRHVLASVIYCGIAALSILLAYLGLVLFHRLYSAGATLVVADIATAYYMAVAAQALCRERLVDYVRAVVNPMPLIMAIKGVRLA